MAGSHLIIRFEGAGADAHRLDLRQLGQSLIGVERIITYGLFVLDAGRPPRKREPMPLLVQASAPQPGCVEIETFLVPGLVFAPFLHEIFVTMASDVVWRWLSGVLRRVGGRESEAKENFAQLVQLLDRVDERRHREMMARHIEAMEWQRLSGFAKDAVSPIGTSCNRMVFPHDDGAVEIDLPMADVIRSKDKLEVGEMSTMRIRVDGFTHHNRQLKVRHPDEPGRFITAHVRDPAFEQAPNIYTEAATREAWLDVTAKPTLKDGRIHAIYIMDARIVENGQDDEPA